MHIEWHFTAKDLAAVREIVERHATNPVVLDRRARNLALRKEAVSRARFWRALCVALLTTQQPSGPASAVSRLLAATPFPLDYATIVHAKRPDTYANQTLVRFGGISPT